MTGTLPIVGLGAGAPEHRTEAHRFVNFGYHATVELAVCVGGHHFLERLALHSRIQYQEALDGLTA